MTTATTIISFIQIGIGFTEEIQTYLQHRETESQSIHKQNKTKQMH